MSRASLDITNYTFNEIIIHPKGFIILHQYGKTACGMYITHTIFNPDMSGNQTTCAVKKTGRIKIHDLDVDTGYKIMIDSIQLE